MKFQLIIFSALLIGALAHPVPDEEVSPVKADLPTDAKPELTQALAEKPLEKAKSEILNPEEAQLEKKLPEKLALPETAPDAEIAQTIPEKNEEKPALEKQTRSEDNVDGEVKALPVVETPVAGIEAQKQIIDEVKPAVQEVQPTGKSADTPAETSTAPEAIVSEQKKDELSAAEPAPAIKSEIPVAETTAAIAEEKKEEQPARQERGTEEQVQQTVGEEAVQPAAEAPVSPVADVNSEVQPQTKSLAPEEANPEAANVQEAAEPALKSAAQGEEAPEKLPEPAAAAGDIPAAQITPESNLKNLPIEAEKLQASPASSAAPEAKKIDEQAAIQPLDSLPEASLTPAAPAVALVNAEQLKKLEAILDEKKSEESKESKESNSDSKESEESKENKSN